MRDVRSLLISRLVARSMTAMGRERTTGVKVFDASAEDPNVLETHRLMLEAISMLDDHSKIHVRWMRRCVQQILLARSLGSPASFDQLGRSIFLDCTLGARYDAVAIAAMLAHEIAHSRVAMSGVRLSAKRFDLRVRVERRCVREQLEALLRIDQNHYFVRWSREVLDSGSESQFTRSSAEERAARRRVYRQMRERGVPRWISRITVRAFRSPRPGVA